MEAQDLAAWQERMGFRTQKAAAAELDISPLTYHRKLRGLSRISGTEARLCHCLEERAEMLRLLDIEALTYAEESIHRMIRLVLQRHPYRAPESTRFNLLPPGADGK